MPYAEVPLAPGVVTEDHPALAKPRYQSTNKTRFYRGWPQPVGGRQQIGTIAGVPRGMFSWADNEGATYGAIGTHSKLYVYYRSFVYDITPLRATHTIAIGGLVTNGTATATITDSGHGAITGDTVYNKGNISVGGVQWGGGAGTLTNPFTTTAASEFITVVHTAHGLTSGETATFSGASSVGGITPSGDYVVRVEDANTYEIQHSAPAGTAATGGGTVTYSYHRHWIVTVVDANDYTITAATTATTSSNSGTYTAEYEINIGFITGSEILSGATGGYGGGYYGLGPAGALISHSPQNYPRIWTFAPWGQNLDACPFLGAPVEWALNTSTKAAAISGVPAGGVGTIFVTPYRQLFLCGANDGSAYDPLFLNFSDQEDNTNYTPGPTNLAGDFTLSQGSQVMRGASTDLGIVVWTDKALYPLSYQGDPNAPYSLGNPLATNCGLIAPNAFAGTMGGQLMWIGTNYNFYSYNGTAVTMLPCDVRAAVLLNMAPLQEWKIWGATCRQWNEFWFGWQSQTSATSEVDSYVIYCPTDGWSLGTWDITAWHDKEELGCIISGNASTQLFAQELGTSDNGSPLIARARTYDFDFGAGHPKMDLKGYIPMFSQLSVGCYLNVYPKEYPASASTVDNTNLDGTPYTIIPGLETQDLRSNGRLASVEWVSIPDVNCFWHPAGFWLDLGPSGTR